jgi:hypothetical protein
VASNVPRDATGTIVSLVGVYHADGNLWGELSYWIGARLGRAHCALCDITHGTFRRKAAWDACTRSLPVPFATFHLNDRPDDVAAATDGATPCVVARLADGGLAALAGPTDLEGCEGEPAALVAVLERSATAAGLVWGQ